MTELTPNFLWGTALSKYLTENNQQLCKEARHTLEYLTVESIVNPKKSIRIRKSSVQPKETAIINYIRSLNDRELIDLFVFNDMEQNSLNYILRDYYSGSELFIMFTKYND